MGCWNQTCGLTQIHIRAGEPVLVFPLIESNRDSLCYSTPYWTPFPIPFASEYNDYGGGENSSGLGLDMILHFLQKNLAEIEQGENKYHDIAVKREGFDEDKFWEAIHEMRLKVNVYNKEKEIGFVMIKQSVVDYLIEHEQFSQYEGYDEKGSKYTKYKFADILTSLEVVLDKLFVVEEEDSDVPEELREKLKFLMRYNALERISSDIVDADKHNWAAQWLRYGIGSHLGYSGFSSSIVENKLFKYVEAGDREGARELMVQFFTMKFIDSFMMGTRKFWSPQAGAGSQNNDQSGYRLLMGAMAHVLDEEKAERDAWEDGDE